MWNLAKEALLALNSAGHEAYVCGGAVRDELLGLEPKDYDLATSATPEQIMELLGGTLISAAVAYPVVKVGEMEVATFRSDGADRKDLNGIKVGATLLEDAQRRDFTVNALYKDASGKYVDPTGQGLHDLQGRRLRFVGDPSARLAEDPLRALRAVRFAAKLGFSFAGETKEALKNFSLTL